MKILHLSGLGIILILGLSLFFIRTDRPVIHLQPTPGAANIISLQANETYEFQFKTNLPRITRFGFYVTPLEKSLPASTLSLQIYRGQDLVGESEISSSFIDQERPLEWRFSPPLSTKARETLLVRMIVPSELSGKIGVKVRLADGTFRTEDTKFFIGNQAQTAPLAYEVYTAYIPPLALQVGSLLILSAVVLAATYHMRHTINATHMFVLSLLISSIAIIPGLVLGANMLSLFLIQATAWYFMFTALRLQGRSMVASVAGASIFAFTSWFALHLSADHTLYGLMSVVPLIGLWKHRSQLSITQRTYLFLFLILIIVRTVVTFTSLPESLPSTPASVRDILFDPNQIPTITKTADNAAWYNFGSYIGLIAGALSIIGLLSSYRRPKILIPLLIVGIIVCTPLAYSVSLPISPAHLSILLVYLLAHLAAQGLDTLRLFLGAKDAIVTTILLILTGIITLDLWQVLTPILELPHLL